MLTKFLANRPRESLKPAKKLSKIGGYCMSK